HAWAPFALAAGRVNAGSSTRGEGETMGKRPLLGVLPVLVALALVAIPAGGGAIPTNVDVSQRVGNESEKAIPVKPTNPQNIVVVTNIQEGFSGLFEGISFDGGQTWTRRIIATGHTHAGG